MAFGVDQFKILKVIVWFQMFRLKCYIWITFLILTEITPFLYRYSFRSISENEGTERNAKEERALKAIILFGSLSNLHLVSAQVVDPDPAGYDCFGQSLDLVPDPDFSRRSFPGGIFEAATILTSPPLIVASLNI